MRGRRWRWPATASAVLALGLTLTACGTGDGSGSAGSGGAASEGSGDVRLTIQDFSFRPSTIQGSAGETLTIDVSNEDSVEHSFTLDDDSVSQDLEGGDRATVEVTLPDSGTVGWHCEYHPDTMKGTIEVS
jgi:plastocyanin